MEYALISVFDKTGVVDFAKELSKLGYKIISTGGTAKVLFANNIPVIPIQEITGNPECFDGRIKTISFQIESGILFDRANINHRKEAEKLRVKPIDLVVCNLYPFEKTVENPNVKLETAVENIDVGGPTMIRAAAKNFKNVLTVIDPKDYISIARALQKKNVNLELRQKLAAKAFAHLSFYDSQISRFLQKESFPEEVTLPGRKTLTFRYGENPHQTSALYLEPNTTSPFKELKKYWGRDLSLINLTDITAGIESVRLFAKPAAVVIKHNTPCGIALGNSIQQALMRAIKADPISAFGGVIVLNQPIDIATTKVIMSFKDETHGNFDIVAAPEIDENALELLKKIRKSMGIYTFSEVAKCPQRLNIKWIEGGFILQDADDNLEDGFKNWQIVTKKKPTLLQIKQMQIAWKFVTRIKSNAVIIVDPKIPMTRGIGSGQTSRVAATKIALEQAGKYTKGAVMASDAFFPFPDSVELAAKHGVGVIIQQGGSIKDKLVIEAANKAGIPMIFTNRRAFWH